MANRLTRPVQFAFEANTTFQYTKITFGAAGAPTLDTRNSKGVCNVAKSATGTYVITFGSQFTPFKRLDAYAKLLKVSANWIGTAAPSAPAFYVSSNDISDATKASITLVFGSYAGAVFTAADPTSGDAVMLENVLCNSTAI